LQQAFGAVYGHPLAELRHAQLAALLLPSVGYASAMDLGDASSPFGNVHFRNKQAVARRAVAAALSILGGGGRRGRNALACVLFCGVFFFVGVLIARARTDTC
jgi:hypothetical protein